MPLPEPCRVVSEKLASLHDIESSLRALLRDEFRCEIQALGREILCPGLENLRVHIKKDICEHLQSLHIHGHQNDHVTHAGHRRPQRRLKSRKGDVDLPGEISDDTVDFLVAGGYDATRHVGIVACNQEVACTSAPTLPDGSLSSMTVERPVSQEEEEESKVGNKVVTTRSARSFARSASDLGRILRSARASTMIRGRQLSNLGFTNSRCMRFLVNPRTEQSLDTWMAVFTMLNVVQIGVSADLARDWGGWLVLDGIFCLGFTIEFLLKLLIHGPHNHFLGQHWKWSLFDAIVVLVAIVELVLTLSLGQEEDPGVLGTLFHVVRLLRLTRIVKVLRFPFFKDLMMMLNGLIDGARTLFWSIVLLLMPIYVSAIILRETVGENKQHSDLREPFNSLWWSFFTCFRCIMGDCSADTGQPLPVLLTQKFGAVFGIVYVAVIVVTAFGLFNVIIAIYVENIVAAASKNDAIQRHRQLGDEQRLTMLMAQLVHTFVKVAKGEENAPHFQGVNAAKAALIDVTKSMFAQVTETPEVHSLLDKLDIAHEDRLDLFDVLDADGSGTLTLGEITRGLRRLRGQPRRSDVVSNGLLMRSMQKSSTKELLKLSARIEQLESEMRQLQDVVIDEIRSILPELVDTSS